MQNRDNQKGYNMENTEAKINEITQEIVENSIYSKLIKQEKNFENAFNKSLDYALINEIYSEKLKIKEKKEEKKFYDLLKEYEKETENTIDSVKEVVDKYLNYSDKALYLSINDSSYEKDYDQRIPIYEAFVHDNDLEDEEIIYIENNDTDINTLLKNIEKRIERYLTEHNLDNKVLEFKKDYSVFYKMHYIEKTPMLKKEVSKKNKINNIDIISTKQTSQKAQYQEQKNYAKIPMNKLLEQLGFEINKSKTSQSHIVMSDGVDKVIISRGKGYEKDGKLLGVGNYIYFNPQNNKDNGTIYQFCKNRNIDIHKLVKGAEIKDYSHNIIISDSRYYDPELSKKFKELKSYNQANMKSLSKIRKINPSIIKVFDNIKVDEYKNIVFPTVTVENFKTVISNDKTKEKSIEKLIISGMNKKLIERPFTHDKQGNKLDKPIKSLEEGKSGLTILKTNNAKIEDITTIVTGENSIDNLSYAEIKKIDLSKTLLVAFNGSMKNEAIKAFNFLLDKQLPNVKNITAAFDNDIQGIKYDEKLKDIIKDKKLNLNIDKPKSKDWNEELTIFKKDLFKTYNKARNFEKSFTLELEK